MSNAKIISIIDHETAREALARQHDIELAVRLVEHEFVPVKNQLITLRVEIDQLKQRVVKLEEGGVP